MTSTIFSEAFLTISSIAIATILAASIIAGVNQMNNIQVSIAMDMEEKIGQKVKIIYASTDGSTTVYLWIKNIGIKPIALNLVGEGELYFGQLGQEKLIPFNTSSLPTWNYTIVDNPDNDGYWDRSETIQLNIYLDTALQQGDYHVLYTTYLGELSDYYFSI